MILIKAKKNIKGLFLLGLILYVVSFLLKCLKISSDEAIAAAFVAAGGAFSALGTPLLLLIFGQYIDIKKTDKWFVPLMCTGVCGSGLIALSWMFVAVYGNATWSNVVDNLFPFLLGICITCIFEACNNARSEMEETFKK